jgi:ribosomal protein L37E
VLLPGAGFSQGTPPPEGESEEDVAGSTPCIDNGKASRGHTRCVKCGNNKNPSAKLQCTHCGAFLREQTKARVAQRWAALKEKAKQEGRLADKAWQRRKKHAFEKLTDLTLLDLENTYFAIFISRSNWEGDKFSFDGWCSDGAGHKFVTTGDVEAAWKACVKKHHKRKSCAVDGCGDTLDEEHITPVR